MTNEAMPAATTTRVSALPGPSAPKPAPPSSGAWKLASRTAGWTRPLAGRRFFPLWGVVRHRGRKSGVRYEIPVVVRGNVHTMVIPLPWGATTNWVRNVIAAGECVVVWKGAERRMVDPVVVGPVEAAADFGRFQRWALQRFGIAAFLRVQSARPEPSPPPG